MHQYVRVSDITEIRRFLHDTKDALKCAKQSGGGYSAFLHNEDGAVILQLEIAPKARL